MFNVSLVYGMEFAERRDKSVEMKKIFLSLLLLLISVPALSQTNVTPTSKLIWDYPNVTLAVAQAFGENYYVDAATTGVALTGKTCTFTTNLATCQTAFPALTPGAHTLAITATSSGLESTKSNVLSFSFVILIVPTNLRIGKNNIVIFPNNLKDINQTKHG